MSRRHRQPLQRPAPRKGRWDEYYHLVETVSWCPLCEERGHSIFNCPWPGKEEGLEEDEESWKACLSVLEAENLCQA
ncbi:UNVERIFIED_CONTAM: hypothetical protein FKN15_033093 [Acipenser sinensis]